MGSKISKYFFSILAKNKQSIETIFQANIDQEKDNTNNIDPILLFYYLKKLLFNFAYDFSESCAFL